MALDPFRNYDSWLEAPYQRTYAQEPPPDVEDLLGQEFWLDGERAVIDAWEAWEDADEDGRHGGVDLVVRIGGHRDERYGFWKGGRTQNMSPSEVEEALTHQGDHRGED